MTALFRRTFFILLIMAALLSVDALAQSGVNSMPSAGTRSKVSGKKTMRKKIRYRPAVHTGRKSIRRAIRKAPFRSQPVTRTLTGQTQASIAATTPKVTTTPSAEHSVGATVTTEQVQYAFAGYVATEAGTPARMWRSREYTVHSSYAYLGRMKFGETWEHVWMETAGNLLAGAVTETSAEQMPAVAQMMERFPDGGLGVVVAGWDDFAPPAEAAVEVVEFGPGQPGITH